MWIESHQSIRNHPKVKKAARLADISEPEMIGRLHYLWWWALDYAPDGDVTKYNSDDIEMAVDWNGTPGAFYNALLQCGFNGHCGLIEDIDGSIVIHDWREYGGRLLEKREANRDRMREKRAAHVQDTTSARTGATEHTEQNKQNKQNRTEQTRAADAALPRAVQTYINNGGGWQPGKLKDGTSKKQHCFNVIAETVKDTDESIKFWGRVVFEYCKQWSSKSYTVMLNEYYLRGRIPGQSNNGNGQSGNGNSAEPSSPMLRAIARREGKLT